MKLDGCSAVITGASAGIGREFARSLAQRASRLILVARRRDRLEQLRAELIAAHPSLRVDVREVDLSRLEQTMQFADALANESIDFLINNAGLGDLGAFASADPVRVNEQVQVNVLALTALTRAVLPRMIENRRGAILNVSSSAGFLPVAEYSVYAATKAYVNSFSEGLRADLRGTGVRVCALCPGPVHTEFLEAARRRGQPSLESGDGVAHVSAMDVVRAGLRAIERDRPVVIPGLVMKIGMFLLRLTPMPILRPVLQLLRRHA
jgi:short-subunit dehydrogenase